jgi:hypothetical protein
MRERPVDGVLTDMTRESVGERSRSWRTGFLFQHHTEFAADVEAFLSDPGRGRGAQIC